MTVPNYFNNPKEVKMVFGNKENIQHHESKLNELSKVEPQTTQEASELHWEKKILESNLNTIKRVEELNQIIDLRKGK
jgi:hypothetical protein